jgi:hypothetical protein
MTALEQGDARQQLRERVRWRLRARKRPLGLPKSGKPHIGFRPSLAASSRRAV